MKNNIRGIGAIIIGSICFSVNDVSVKLFSSEYALHQLMFFRAVFAIIILSLFGILKNFLRKNFIFYLLAFFGLIINLFVWFQAPEIRFGWGTIITLTCFLLSILVFHIYFLNSIKIEALRLMTIFIFALLGFKTIITPRKPIIILIQLIKLRFSFKINLAKIKRKKGVVINKVVKIFKGIYFRE